MITSWYWRVDIIKCTTMPAPPLGLYRVGHLLCAFPPGALSNPSCAASWHTLSAIGRGACPPLFTVAVYPDCSWHCTCSYLKSCLMGRYMTFMERLLWGGEQASCLYLRTFCHINHGNQLRMIALFFFALFDARHLLRQLMTRIMWLDNRLKPPNHNQVSSCLPPTSFLHMAISQANSS